MVYGHDLNLVSTLKKNDSIEYQDIINGIRVPEEYNGTGIGNLTTFSKDRNFAQPEAHAGAQVRDFNLDADVGSQATAKF